MRLHNILPIFFLAVTSSSTVNAGVAGSVQSPDGTLTVQLLTDDSGTLRYTVGRGTTVLIAESALGIHTSAGDFTAGLTAGEPTTRVADETYTLPSGKKNTYINKYNELTLPLTRDDKAMRLVMRVYDDGVAYRYELDGEGTLTVVSEASECSLVKQDAIYSQVYSRDYKNIAEASDWERESCLQHTSLPLLAQAGGDDWVLLTEACVGSSYASAMLRTDDASQAFVYTPVGSVQTVLPFCSPWRVAMIGTPAVLAESTLMENLNPAATDDYSWVKPGRAAWNYGGEDTSGYLSMDNVEEYIDYAAEMGWEYFTLDRGWEASSGGVPMRQVVSYAKDKGVGVFLWVNQTKLPADDTSLRNRFTNYKNAGVKGVKIDFWEDDSQEMMKRYEQLLRLTAEQGLMLNLHSCTKPVGLRRTWPHLVTSEAVLSNAYYAESPHVVTASHNINMAVLRGSLGATDYAPADFIACNGKVHQAVTWAHQLALSVVFESGVQHINESPDNLRYHVAQSFLKTVPAAWDDTRCLEAAMDSYITTVRRSGEDWYVGALATDARTAEIDLSFLESGKTYNAYLYKDGICPSDLRFEYREGLTAADKLSLPLSDNGGAAVILSPSATYDKPEFITYEAESEDNLIPFGVAVRADVDSLCSGNEYVTSIGNGRGFTFRKVMVPQSGTYALTFYYMSDVTRTASVEINDRGETWREYSFTGTTADTGSGLGCKTILVELNAATENTIEFGNPRDYAPSVDRIELSLVEAGATGVEDVEAVPAHGVVYTSDRHIIIEQDGDAQYLLFNSIGQVIKAGSLRDGQVSIPVAEAGIYLLQVTGSSGEWMEKVMVR